MEKEKTVRFDKYASQAMKGIAIVMMLFHHQYLSRKRFEGFTVSFAPFADDTMIYMCSVFKICVPIYAFISGYGLYLSYRKKRSAPVRWTGRPAGQNHVRVLDHLDLICGYFSGHVRIRIKSIFFRRKQNRRSGSYGA